MTAVDVTDPLRLEKKKTYVNCASVEKVAQTTLSCPSVCVLASTGVGRLSHLPHHLSGTWGLLQIRSGTTERQTS